MKKHFLSTLLGLFVMMFSLNALAQSIVVKGKVLDESNEPLIGASVILKGTQIGTATNVNGEFTLNVNVKSGSYDFEFRSVGFRSVIKKVIIGKESPIVLSVQLPTDALGLDEVIVTGTSVATSKKQLGNAVTSLKASDLQYSAATSIDQALSGKIAGAQITQNSGNPAGGISVRLRGPSTIVGSSDPLYIVDGVIVNNDSRELLDLGGYAQNRLVDLNPNDIERIEVIKGAAAAAIYGSRASNGVVQIFTKKGKDGKASVSFSSTFRVSEVRKTLPYNTYGKAFVNTVTTDLTQTDVTRYDFQKDIFRQAVGNEQYLSVSGGNQNSNYFFSGSMFQNQGIIKSSDFNRANVRMRIGQHLNKWASLTVGGNYTYSSSNEIPNGGINEAYGALTGFIFSNNFVNPAKNETTGAYPSTAPTAVLRRTNPLEAIDRFKFKQSTSRFTGDVQLNLTPIEGLGIDYTFGLDTYTQLGTAYIPPVNTTPSYDAGLSRRADANVLQVNNDLNIRYQTKIADFIESTTGVGGTIQYDRSQTTSINAQQLGIFGETVNNGALIVAGESRAERAFAGVFVQQTFGISNKLYLTGAGRWDAASVYGVDNRWQFYPKASASYVISNEEFWKNNLEDILPNFKVRAAWGQAGNLTAIGAYDRFTNYSPVTTGGLNGYLAPLTLGNFTVKPERQTELEIGTDFSLLKDRIGVEFTYYNKEVKDLILNRTLAPTTGYNNRFVNIGTMTNKGFEVMVRAIPIQNKNVKWTSTITYTQNKNVIDGVEGNGVLPFAGGFSQVAAVNGYSLGAFYSTFFARKPDGTLLLTPAGLPQRERGTQLANGQYTIGRDANGQPSGAILSKVIGNPNPTAVYSFINEVEYKKFTFRLQLDAMQGFDVFNFTRRVGERDLYGGLAGYEPELKGQVPKGTSAALFSIFENYIEKGSFVKVREVSISYMATPKALGLKNIRILLAGRNLLSFDNYSGYDPEVNSAGQSNAVRGFDFVEVPIPRQYSIGLTANF